MTPRGLRPDGGAEKDPPGLDRVRVSVPASTSNLGPGFDCFGLALGLRNELTLEVLPGKGKDEVIIEGEGADSLPRDGSNVVLRAARAAAGPFSGRLRLRCVNRIPLARGLGSSAAAIVGGVWAGGSLLAPHKSDEQLEALAVELEGHPDNVAPCVRGGFTVSVAVEKGALAYPFPVNPALTAVVVIPEFKLETAKARAALPKKVPLADAVFSASRAVALARAIEGGLIADMARLMDDRLHQPYRAKLVPGLSEALAAAEEAGALGAALSGSGPTVFAFVFKDHARPVGEAVRRVFAKHGIKARALPLKIEKQGVTADVGSKWFPDEPPKRGNQ